MLTFPAPQRLNGARLREELAAAGVQIGPEDVFLVEGELQLPTLDQSQHDAVAAVLAAHTGAEDRGAVRQREVRDEARTAWAVLNDKARWDGLTAAQRNEATRRILRALVRAQFAERVEEVT